MSVRYENDDGDVLEVHFALEHGLDLNENFVVIRQAIRPLDEYDPDEVRITSLSPAEMDWLVDNFVRAMREAHEELWGYAAEGIKKRYAEAKAEMERLQEGIDELAALSDKWGFGL